MLLLLSLYPHHHHEGGAVCVVEEICATDGHPNDEHTAHGAEHHRDSHYCYWQPANRGTQTAPQGWNAPADGPQFFLPPELLRVPEPSAVWLHGAMVQSAVPFQTFCQWKSLSRRGPPLV